MKGSWYEKLHRILHTMPEVEHLPDGGAQISSGPSELTKIEIAATDVVKSQAGQGNSEKAETRKTKLGISSTIQSLQSASQPEIDVYQQINLPNWFEKAPPTITPLSKPLNPSQPVSTDMPVGSVATDARMARLHGQLVHELLEWLPDIAPPYRAHMLAQYFGGRADISDDVQMRVTKEILQLLDNTELADLFAPSALCEVPIVGVVSNMPVSGQIDRLCISASRIIIADFKTGQVPTKAAATTAYHRQLALYAELVSQIYPSHQIESYIVWTRTSELMLVSAKERQAAIDVLQLEMQGPTS